jgi:hypothetical protein
MPRVSPILVFAALLACERAPLPDSAVLVKEPAPAAVTPVAPTPIPPPVAALEAGPIGVEPCDRYVDNYRRCIAEALPEDQRPIHTEVLDGQRLAWAHARADETLAAGLADACEAATTAARVAVPRCRLW